MAIFKCSVGQLECLPVDMKEIREKAAEWEREHPEPAVPLIAFPTFEAVTSGRGVDMLPNREDEGYQAAYKAWNWKRYQLTESMMLKRSVKMETGQDYQTLALILIDGKDGGMRQQLYAFIRGISEVTQEAVDTAGR